MADLYETMAMMPMMMFSSWYKKDVAPHLTKKEKEALLKKISDLSLERDITAPELEVEKKNFPELAPYMHTEKLSGLQLYAVMQELFGELHGKKAKWFKKSYPDFPTAKKKLKKVL
jgi:hypothetical protein